MRLLICAMSMIALLAAPAAEAAPNGPLKRACLKSDRQSKSVWLCGCLQFYADRSLTRKDQQLAASFFKDPHKAQVIRQSDNPSHERFWKKYKVFGANFAKACKRR